MGAMKEPEEPPIATADLTPERLSLTLFVLILLGTFAFLAAVIGVLA